jgi:hypothetical protein
VQSLALSTLKITIMTLPIKLVQAFAMATICFTIVACKKEKNTTSKAVITGFDKRLCACCGGLVINFEGDTSFNSSNYYLVINKPEEFGIAYDSQFPIYVNVDWEKISDGCLGKEIKINKLERR